MDPTFQNTSFQTNSIDEGLGIAAEAQIPQRTDSITFVQQSESTLNNSHLGTEAAEDLISPPQAASVDEICYGTVSA